MIAVSPCRSIDLPPIVVKPPQWFTPDQALSVPDGLTPAWRTKRLLGFYTALRWGELSGLLGRRIDTRPSSLAVVEVDTKSAIKECPHEFQQPPGGRTPVPRSRRIDHEHCY
ncbi:hypothetical protein [Streptomyces sp. FXJ7.023]|uniref:hypothetical protein n=1 Tax=Streptomyces sp. FXJ7.023 TaxID=579932 RepID=UPI0018F8A661|nr:hypothetical protein [Streptomyces sp. FXJ7.023]